MKQFKIDDPSLESSLNNKYAHSNSGSAENLRVLLGAEKRDIGIIVTYGVCSGILALIVPIAVQMLVNTIAFGSMLQPILVLTLFVFLMLGSSAFLRGLQVYLMELVQQRVFARTALTLAQRIPRMSQAAFDGYHGPELMNRFFDVLTVQKSTALIVIDGLSVLLQTGVGMILLAFYHPLLLVFDVILVGLITGLVFLLGRGAIDTSVLESKKKYQVASWLEELARIPNVFKNPVASGYAFREADGLTFKYLKGRKAHFRILLKQIIGTLSLQVIASSALLGLGGWLVVKRQLTLGQLVAAELVVTSVVTGVGKFGKYLESYYDLSAAADKLTHVLDLPIEKRRESLILRASDQATRSGLCFVKLRYPRRTGEPFFKDLSLRIEPRQKVAIYGSRSSGKRTLCDLLYGLKDPEKGVIELNGISLKDLSLDDYRTRVGLLRGIDLFEGSVARNLSINRGDITVNEIYEVLASLGILDEVKALPEGLETYIAGANTQFSTGLSKLLILARVILSQYEIVVADCFFDDLDDYSKKFALEGIMKVPSAFVVTTGSEAVAGMFERQLTLSNGILSDRLGKLL